MAINKNIFRAIIFSDSLSAIQKINRCELNPWNNYISLRTKRLITRAREQGLEVSLSWIPGHADIRGNEAADMLAKIGKDLNVPKKIDTDKQDIIPLLKEKILKEFQTSWKASLSVKGRAYADIVGEFPTEPWYRDLQFIDRRHITTIIRMRTGHCLTAKHLCKIGIKDSPRCECGQVEDLEHMFLECPINIIPGFCMYQEFRKIGFSLPLNMNVILRKLGIKTINLILRFLNYNKIKL